MQYLGCVKSLEGLILLGFWAGSRCGLVLFSFAWALAADALEQSLAMCPELPQKRQRMLLSQHWHSWGISLPSLLSFVMRSEVVSFCAEVLPCVEPGLFFCFVEEFLLALLSVLDALGLDLDLFLDDSEMQDSQETSPFHSQYCASMPWTSFWRPERVSGLLWLTILSLMHLASPL